MANGVGQYISAGIGSGIGNFLRRKIAEKEQAAANEARFAQEQAIQDMKEKSDMRRMQAEIAAKREMAPRTDVYDDQGNLIPDAGGRNVEIKQLQGSREGSKADNYMKYARAAEDIFLPYVDSKTKELVPAYTPVETQNPPTVWNIGGLLARKTKTYPTALLQDTIDKVWSSPRTTPAHLAELIKKDQMVPAEDKPALMKYAEYRVRGGKPMVSYGGYAGPIPSDTGIMVKAPTSSLPGISSKAEASPQKQTKKSKYDLE